MQQLREGRGTIQLAMQRIANQLLEMRSRERGYRDVSDLSTGSLYLCLFGLVELGLPASDPFWTAPAEPWTQKRIWSGADIPADHAYKDKK